MASTVDPVVAARAALREVNDSAVRAGVLPSTYDEAEPTMTVARRRRRRAAGLADPIGIASLMINDEGVLIWQLGDINGLRSGRRRLRRGVPEAAEGEVVELYHYDKLDPNEINDFLQKKDEELNDHQGLSELNLKDPGTPIQTVERKPIELDSLPAGKKKRLLFIHGTFSKSEAFFDGMQSAVGGRGLMNTLFDRYDQVLAFDHPTLSASPVMNAFDLARMLAKADGPLDVIAHSRGGLVARWTLEGYGLNGSGPYRAVLVGSPLNGTSLASPAQLRHALSALSNIGNVLKSAGAAAVAYVPFLTVPLALVRIASSVVTVAARTPLVDAAVALIPGLHGQSRVAHHPELMRLRALHLAKPPEYFVVQANFETEDPGWKFWKWFRKDKVADVAADWVFPGPNDLVVDTSSMADIPHSAIPAKSVKDFGTTSEVYHTNYFAHRATLDFMLDKLSP